MADESTLTIAHSYDDANGVSLANFGVADLSIDVATLHPSEKVISVATTEQALDLDGITAAKAMLIGKNLDDTNYLEIRTGTGGSNDAYYFGPGECFCFRFGSDVTAPYIIANTAACLFQYRLIPF